MLNYALYNQQYGGTAQAQQQAQTAQQQQPSLGQPASNLGFAQLQNQSQNIYGINQNFNQDPRVRMMQVNQQNPIILKDKYMS
jgi:hypothetical protein